MVEKLAPDKVRSMRKDRVHIFSSREAVQIAEAVKDLMGNDIEVTIWTEDVFTPGQYTLEDLHRVSKSTDFVVCILTLDGSATIRGEETEIPNLNVIFELGYFAASLGRHKTFALFPTSAHPDVFLSNIRGLTYIPFQSAREDGNIAAQVGTAVRRIKNAIHKSNDSEFKTNSDKVLTLEEPKQQRLTVAPSSEQFDRRFGRAFPGIRWEMKEFSNPEEAAKRVARLLTHPLPFEAPTSEDVRAWWFRGSSCSQIFEVKQLDSTTLLINDLEFKFERIAAAYYGVYWNPFVYLESAPLPPARDGQQPELDWSGRFIREELCYYGGQYYDRAFYDDGAIDVDGDIIDLDDTAEVRVRYCSPYNMIIAAHDSAVNTPDRGIEKEIELILDGILTGESTLDDLYSIVKKIPKPYLFCRSD